MRLGTLFAAGGALVASVLLAMVAASWLRGRTDGINAANADIEQGTPCIREFLFWRIHLTPDGWGIDRETGLPFQDTARSCSRGENAVAYSARNAAYNATIRAAFAAGKLERFSLNHKVRTAHEIDLLFADARPTRIAQEGDRLRTRNGAYDAIYIPILCGGDDDLLILRIAGTGREAKDHQLFYPRNFAGPPIKPARWPFAAIVVDDETTLLLRDAAHYTWVIDLPRAVIIQVVPPSP